MMSIFAPYFKEIMSSNPYYNKPSLDLDCRPRIRGNVEYGEFKLGRLCKRCGYPWGEHFGNDRCPESVRAEIKQEFHDESLNNILNNIKTI